LPVNPPFDIAQDMVAVPGASAHVIGMAAKDKEREREERLAAALRENLRKRKAQAREISSSGEEKSQP
jgi:hypothetical protein